MPNKNEPGFKSVSPSGYVTIPIYNYNPNTNGTFDTITYKSLEKTVSCCNGISVFNAAPNEPSKSGILKLNGSINTYPYTLAPLCFLTSIDYYEVFFGFYLNYEGLIFITMMGKYGGFVNIINPVSVEEGKPFEIILKWNSESPLHDNIYYEGCINGLPLEFVFDQFAWEAFTPKIMWSGTDYENMFTLDGSIYAFQTGRL
jgi:hypothetical protein